MSFLDVTHVADTALANILTLVGNQILGRGAENTRRFILLEHNAIALHKDFQFVPLSDIQRSAQLYGDYDPPKFINFANDACRLHKKVHSCPYSSYCIYRLILFIIIIEAFLHCVKCFL